MDDIESGEMPSVTFGGSAPASPVSRLTPPSPHDGLNGDKNDMQGDEIIIDDREDVSEETSKDEEKPLISAAELRAQKRKMKRFRYVSQYPHVYSPAHMRTGSRTTKLGS